MALEGRDLISIFDFSDREIEAVFDLADEMSQHTRGRLGLADGLIMCTLFYEPSTRTRLSFEAAMHRLGGNVLSVADTSATSVKKGETIADTVRIIESYADLIVIRNPYEGSAKVAADFASVPVINATCTTSPKIRPCPSKRSKKNSAIRSRNLWTASPNCPVCVWGWSKRTPNRCAKCSWRWRKTRASF